MKKLFFKNFTLLLALLIVCTSNFCLAQNALSPQISPNEKNSKTEKINQNGIQDEINPFSLRPIPKSHIAFQKSIWLEVSFNQKTNLPLWYAGHELSKFLIQNALDGKITAYTDDKLERTINFKDNELNGEYIEFNKFNKAKFIKHFEFGKLKQLIVNDSLGNKIAQFDIFDRNLNSLKCLFTVYKVDKIVSQEFWLKNDDVNHNLFQLVIP